jgi:hypothetical protein
MSSRLNCILIEVKVMGLFERMDLYGGSRDREAL